VDETHLRLQRKVTGISCCSITKNLEAIITVGAQGQPKGNGIKDGFVREICVYAVVFWLPWSGYCASGRPGSLAGKIFL
jgi:hypothetical protein